MSGILSLPPTFFTALMILALKGALFLVLIFLIRLVIRTASASARYFLIAAGIITVGCLPLLTLITPDWKLPLPAALQTRIVPEPAPLPSLNEPSHTLQIDQPSTAPIMAEEPSFSTVALGDLFLYLWLLGTAAAIGRVLMGLAGGAKKGRPIMEPDLTYIGDLIGKASMEIGFRQDIAVRVGGRTGVPHVRGIIRPVLYLPQNVLRWPEDRLMSVLLHELAHIKRGDHFLWPLANLAVSWLWFNPLVWLALAQMRKEKERACDDYVVAYGRCRINYAQHLLDACLSLRGSAKLAPFSLQFAQKNEVQERITYMLNQRMDRRPISRAKQLAFIFLILTVLVPLTSITGFSAAIASGEVSPGEREAVATTLKAFYAALSDGADFQTVNERFLTSDYFDDPSLTLENLDKAVWLPVFDNTLCCITEGRSGVVQQVRSRMASIRREGDELVATLQLDITGFCLDKKQVRRREDSSVVLISDKITGAKTAIRECPVVDSLSEQIRFRLEDNDWKISQFNGGVALMRMDTNNPYGPIFLVWIENIDKRTTPSGARVFKIIPRDIVPDAHNAKFVLEE